jgi:hypothetical protein
MEYVSNQLFFYTISSMIAITGAVVGYWIKEIKGVGESLDKHKENDEKQFSDYRLEVLNMHQSMERHFTERNNTLEKSIVQMHEHIKYVKTSIDELKSLTKKNI